MRLFVLVISTILTNSYGFTISNCLIGRTSHAYFNLWKSPLCMSSFPSSVQPLHEKNNHVCQFRDKRKDFIIRVKDAVLERWRRTRAWLHNKGRTAPIMIATLILVWLVNIGKFSRINASTLTNTNPSTTVERVLHKPFSQSNAFSDRKIKNLNYKRNEEKSNKIQIIREKKEISKYVNSVEDDIEDADAVKEVKRSLRMLINNLEGAKLDSLILLIVTAAVIPICKRLNTSPIIGFLLMGTLTGPNWLNWIRAHNVHVIDVIGDLGIVFFLFEMGLELSLERLNAMKRDVFYLGTSQFLGTAAAGTALSKFFGLPTRAAVTIGGSLALSSSAFVLQLLKDQNNMGTRYGRVSFGILLLQDLAVVPLLVIVDILSSGGTGLWKALGVAGMKAMITLTSMTILGKSVLDKVFNYVAKSRSQEAFLGIILSSVLFMSFITEGIGLSNTLGAFLAGLLLSETKYRYQIESDIAPFRGLLLGIFFMTVGFNIDPKLMLKKGGKIFGLLAMMIAGKTAITTAICRLSGIAPVDAIQCGLMTSQGSELAFVALGIAERGSLLSPELTKILLTTVALSMAITPALDSLGHYIGNRIEQNQGFANILGQDKASVEIKAGMKPNEFAIVCGYGRVGKMVCDMLDRKLVRYLAFDYSPQKAVEARQKGLPVFFGDINRPEVLKNFNAGAAKACVITFSDMAATNKAVANVRKMFPQLPIVVRAKNQQHQRRLEALYENVYAMSPVLAEDSVLLTLPFGGRVLRQVGVAKPEIDAILEDFRKMYCADPNQDLNDDTFDYLDAFRRRLPPSTEDYDYDDDIGTFSNDKQSSDEEEMTAIEDVEITTVEEDDEFSEVKVIMSSEDTVTTKSNSTVEA